MRTRNGRTAVPPTWRAMLAPAVTVAALPLAATAAGSVTVLCQGVAIPAYFYPGPLWDKAIASAPTTRYMIMNPNSGPGQTSDPNYVAAVRRAQAAGIDILGYVHTSYGMRAATDVEAEIDLYRQWYAVDGIFLDETASSPAQLPYYQRLADHARTAPGTVVVLNPGTHPDQAYAALADVVMTFEGTYAQYWRLTVPTWTRQYPPERFWHLVYAANSSQMSSAVSLARNRRAANLYITNDVLPNPWDTLPPYWSTELYRVKRLNPTSCTA